ncbi:MAG: Do family serine endopeptidase [Alphaproteobacteria bacterium]|nr:Do family serine endopeptidase [Alphaproteobacteria bacterium]
MTVRTAGRPNWLFRLVALTSMLLVAVSSSPHAHDPALIPNLVERVLPAVVNISAKNLSRKNANSNTADRATPKDSPFAGDPFFENFFKPKPKGKGGKNKTKAKRTNSLGSGFVIDAAGLVVTNNHVIADADEITVGFSDGTKLKAKIVGRDSKTNLAVLKVEPVSPLTSITFGDSETLRVGEQVIAIGNPFGLGGTVSVGIVSAKNRDINAGPYDDYFQTDAAINRGNSGGPVFNLKGEVVGIATAIISPTGGSIGLGFAIPSSTAKRVVNQLRQFGETRRGKIGVLIQPVTDEIASSLGLTKAKGALVSRVTPGDPADIAGLKPGDVVLRWNGVVIAQVKDLPRMVARTPIGSIAELEVFRDGETLTKSLKIGRLDETADTTGKKSETSSTTRRVVELSGMTVEALTPELRARYKLGPKVEARLVITKIDPNSDAAEKRVKVGDAILEIAQTKMSRLADLVKRAKELKNEGRNSFLLLVSDKVGDLRFLAVRFPRNGPIVRYVERLGTSGDANGPPSIADVQRMLADLGYDPGPIDGKMGGKTKTAIRKFQSDQRQSSDGLVSSQLADALRGALKQKTAVKNEEKTSETENLGDLDDLESGGSQ